MHREFPEQASEWNDPKGRRQFLKLMSASLALAGVGACTKQPVEQIVPYVRQPEDLVHGRPLFFASAIPFSGYAQPVLVESHMGRPTKIEGNPEHPASLGATDVFAQAAILGLYDPDRAQTLTNRGEVQPWGSFLGAMQSALGAQKARQGAGIRFLTGPITSPSMAELMATIQRDYPQAKWHQYDPISRDGGRMGARQATGTAAEPVYHFDKADVVVSLEGDFLTCGPATVRYQKDFAARRRVTDDRKEMNRLYVVESTPTLTGTKADHRLVLAASGIEAFARALAAGIGAGTPAGSEERRAIGGNADLSKWVSAVTKDLQAHRGRSIVIAGDYQPAAVHALAHAMNQALGNIGATVSYGNAVEVMPADNTASLVDLARAMDAGQVELLVILGGNPVYTAPADVKFPEKLTKVGLVVYHGLYVDETANLSHWNIAATHPLESWGDARSFDGTVSIVQPLIAPLYDGRSEYEVLGVFTPQPDRRGYQIVKEYWTRAFGGAVGWTIRQADGQPFKDAETFWRRALHDGFMPGTAIADGGPATPFAPAPKPATPAPAAAAAGVNTLANPNPPAPPAAAAPEQRHRGRGLPPP
ncbi:MAG: molybdopterin oxidoreductase, partial [Actinobacteria bacterium]|nr:molybdopterin oxidoreductase [Actinomycetota bacterium]